MQDDEVEQSEDACTFIGQEYLNAVEGTASFACDAATPSPAHGAIHVHEIYL